MGSNTAEGGLITTEQLAERLHTTVQTIYYWRVNRKGPPAVRIGRRLLYRSADVDAWLERHLRDPESATA